MIQTWQLSRFSGLLGLLSFPQPPSFPQGPSLPSAPQLPSMQGPSFQGPSFQGTSFQGPSFQGPSYQGPSMPSGSPSGPPPSRPESSGNNAGFWLGVLIFVWSLALVAIIVLILYLAGVNPFNSQKFNSQAVLNAFTSAGLEVSRPVALVPANGFANQVVPFSYVDGFNFAIPTSGASAAGGIASFPSGSELDKARTFLADPARTAGVTFRVYTRDNILIYFVNVASEVKAKQYESALLSMT
jgi:hypothetical protein